MNPSDFREAEPSYKKEVFEEAMNKVASLEEQAKFLGNYFCELHETIPFGYKRPRAADGSFVERVESDKFNLQFEFSADSEDENLTLEYQHSSFADLLTIHIENLDEKLERSEKIREKYQRKLTTHVTWPDFYKAQLKLAQFKCMLEKNINYFKEISTKFLVSQTQDEENQ